MGANLLMNYDVLDPAGRRAVQEIIERVNNGHSDPTRQPWALHTISRVQPPRRPAGLKPGIVIILQWQPGPSTKPVSSPSPARVATSTHAVALPGTPPPLTAPIAHSIK